MNAKYQIMREKSEFRRKKNAISEAVAVQLQQRIEDAEQRTKEQELIKDDKMAKIRAAKEALDKQKSAVDVARKRVNDMKEVEVVVGDRVQRERRNGEGEEEEEEEEEEGETDDDDAGGNGET